MRRWFAVIALALQIVMWDVPSAQDVYDFWQWNPFDDPSGGPPPSPTRHCVRTETYFHCWYE